MTVPTGYRENKIHGKTEVEWAWEFHKNCDQLLHQRLAFFTAAQAMTLAAFMVLTNARFQLGVTPDRIWFIEAGRYTLNIFGFMLSVFTWIVTYPMVIRLDYLNETILDIKIPIYQKYHYAALETFRIPGWSIIDPILARLGFSPQDREPRRFYRNIIPKILPTVEMLMWAILFWLLVWADVTVGSVSQSATCPQVGPSAHASP